MSELPKRKHLTRIPVWLPAEQPVVYFVTACCAERRRVFADPAPARLAVKCLQRTERNLGWKVWQACVMPDHVHLLLSPMQDREQPLAKFVQAWKSCVTLRAASTVPIWQREFFDRLLRSDEKMDEKWRYIRENPVRAGLCAAAEEYQFSGSPEEILERINTQATARNPRNVTGASRPTNV